MKKDKIDISGPNPEIFEKIEGSFEEKSSLSNLTNVSTISDYQKKIVIRDIEKQSITVPYDADLEKERIANLIANRGIKSESTSDE